MKYVGKGTEVYREPVIYQHRENEVFVRETLISGVYINGKSEYCSSTYDILFVTCKNLSETTGEEEYYILIDSSNYYVYCGKRTIEDRKQAMKAQDATWYRVTKEEGNNIYLSIKRTKKTSAKGNVYYTWNDADIPENPNKPTYNFWKDLENKRKGA